MIIAKDDRSLYDTKYPEAVQAFKLAELSRKDAFYDVGCGIGQVCIWARSRCKSSTGIENNKNLAQKATRNVKQSLWPDVRIINKDYRAVFRTQFSEPNVVLFSIIELDLSDFKNWDKNRSGDNFRIVTQWNPPIPIKPVMRAGQYCLTKFPFSTARTGEEWCQSVTGKKSATLDDVIARFNMYDIDRDESRRIERNFKKHFRRLK